MRIELDGLTFGYTPGRLALDQVSLAVEEGEVLALLGPSGSGKTTLLDLVAGFFAPSAGSVRLGGRVASDPATLVAPRRRRIGRVFQDLALWPQLTVEGHLDFVQRSRGLPRSERRREREELLRATGLEGLAARLPSTLSGGEEQRLALARALAGRPEVLLLDEPLASLDRPLRDRMLDLIRRLQRERRVTTIHVTHDREEAFRTAGRAAVLDRGRLLQTGSPEDLYRRPADAVVARLTGPASFVECTVAGGGSVSTPLGTLEVLSDAAAGPREPGSRISVLLRPEQVEVAPSDGGAGAVGTARAAAFSAGAWDVEVEVAGAAVTGRAAERIAPGQPVRVAVRGAAWMLPASGRAP
ncbi:MAG: ABC transporter ATP-binding protein [Planctomycetes bacterium]|nr:ABC transporter ATP-binding protein [Planctomycetota bacterium]